MSNSVSRSWPSLREPQILFWKIPCSEQFFVVVDAVIYFAGFPRASFIRSPLRGFVSLRSHIIGAVRVTGQVVSCWPSHRMTCDAQLVKQGGCLRLRLFPTLGCTRRHREPS